MNSIIIAVAATRRWT